MPGDEGQPHDPFQLDFLWSCSSLAHSVSIQGGGGGGENNKQKLQLGVPKLRPASLDPPRVSVCTVHIKGRQSYPAASSGPSCHEQLLGVFCILLETGLFIMSITAVIFMGKPIKKPSN